MKKKLFQKKDLWLILPFLAAAIALLIWSAGQPSGAGIAVVEKNGKEFCRIDLAKVTAPQTIDVGGPMHVKLRAENGAIWFLSSDCPDKVCIRTGKLSRRGQTAVCLPGKVSVRIVGGKDGYDGYTG